MDKIEKFVRSKLPAFFINEHVKEVVKEALWLCKFYPNADEKIVEMGAWLHDITHSVENHHIASAKTAKEFLNSINFDKNKLKGIIHCIKAHRTSRPPEPKTIEAKIVASADNLAHFTMFSFLSSRMGLDKAISKLKRDLQSRFMLPEALEKAKKLAIDIEHKYRVKIL